MSVIAEPNYEKTTNAGKQQKPFSFFLHSLFI